MILEEIDNSTIESGARVHKVCAPFAVSASMRLSNASWRGRLQTRLQIA